MPTESPKKAENPFFLWLYWRIPAVLLWALFLVILTRVLFPEWVSIYWLALGIPALLCTLYSMTRGVNYFIGCVLWFMFFLPLSAFWIGKRSLLMVKLSGRVLSILSGLPALAIYLALMLVVDVYLITIDSADTLYWIATAAIVVNFLVIVVSLRWAVSPVRLLRYATQGIDGTMKYFDSQPTKENPKNKDSEGTIQTVKWCKDKLDSLCELLNTSSTAAIAACFLLSAGILLSGIVVNYAAIYAGYHRLDDTTFIGLRDGFESPLLYSISVITTSPLDNVRVNSQIEQRIYCCQLVSTVLLVTLFLSMFSVGLGLQQDIINDFRSSINRFRKWIAEKYDLYDLRHKTVAEPSTESPAIKASGASVNQPLPTHEQSSSPIVESTSNQPVLPSVPQKKRVPKNKNQTS